MSRDRIKKRDVYPLEIGFNLQSLYDKTDGKYKFRDINQVPILTIDPVAGTLSFGAPLTLDTETTFTSTVNLEGPVVITGAITNEGLTFSSLVKQIVLPLASGGSTLGAANSFYTDNDVEVKIHQSRFTINPDDYPGASFYLQAVYRAGASGDPARTWIMNLHDITANATITNSEISGTTQSTVGNVLPIATGSTNFRGNLTSGNRDYVVQFRSSNAGLFVDTYEARLVIRF